MISVARLAVFVGITGLIPFIACVVAILALPQYSVSLLNYFYLYSAGILAFMAGVYWPIAMQLDNRCYQLSPLAAMLLSQVFFIIAGVGLLLSPPAQIAVYTLVYLALYITDARWMKEYWPGWYLHLRLVLTLVVTACQITVGAWFFVLHPSHGL